MVPQRLDMEGLQPYSSTDPAASHFDNGFFIFQFIERVLSVSVARQLYLSSYDEVGKFSSEFLHSIKVA